MHLTPDVLGWVGFTVGKAYEEGSIDLFPNVGVIHSPLERLVDELREDANDRLPSPTLTQHIGYLMPQKTTTHWLYRTSFDLIQTTQSLVKAVQENGIPWMRAHQTLQAILAPLTNTAASTPGRWQYQLPTALLLLGRSREAVETALAIRDKNTQDARYCRFIAKFTALAGTH
jgi:hypothetical protein